VLNAALREFAPIIALDAVLFGIVAGLLAWAMTSAFQLYRAKLMIGRALAAGTQALGNDADSVGFAARFEAASVALRQDPLLGAPWERFRDSLIVPLTLGRPVLATTDPAIWFGLPSLFRRCGIDLRYHAALPGLLVGAGLLFTFLGLAAALAFASGVVAEGVEPAKRNAELRNLLDAASVKFVTSIAGLALSILYALHRKRTLQRAEVALSAFCAAIEHRIPLRTSAYLQAEANTLQERQLAAIQGIESEFFVNLGSVLATHFEQGLATNIAPLQSIMQAVADELTQSRADAVRFRDTLLPGIDAALARELAPLATSIAQLANRQASQNEDAVRDMLRTFLGELQGAVTDSMTRVATTLDTLGVRLDGLQGGLDAAAQRMAAAATEMARGMGAGADDALGRITAQIEQLVATLREAAAEGQRNNQAAGEVMAERMAETAATLTAAVEHFQRRLEAGAADGVERLVASIEGLLKQLEGLAAAQREAGSVATEALAATLGRAAAALETTAATAAQTLGSGATQAGDRLRDATETGAKALQGSIEEAASRLREAGDAAGSALRGGGDRAREGMGEAARALVQGSAGLSERLAALGDAANRLGVQAAALQEAAAGAAVPLASGARDLRSAGEAAREAAAPLREVAQALRGGLEGMTGAANALTAARATSDRLAQQVGEAAAKFDGVDRELGQVLTALQVGLKGFQDEIVRFVSEMDNGLAQNTQKLAAIVNSLQQTIEDMEFSKPRGR